MKQLLTGSLVLLLMFSSNLLYSQDEIPTERKVSRMLNAERDIYNLPYERDHIRFVIVPHIEAQRAILAPNYPVTDNIFGDDLKALVASWIDSYPDEYEDFVLFMETYIRSNNQ